MGKDPTRAGDSSSCFPFLPSSVSCSGSPGAPRWWGGREVTQDAGVLARRGSMRLCLPPSTPNSLELFTLFSLPFLHFYNFLGTQG